MDTQLCAVVQVFAEGDKWWRKGMVGEAIFVGPFDTRTTAARDGLQAMQRRLDEGRLTAGAS